MACASLDSAAEYEVIRALMELPQSPQKSPIKSPPKSPPKPFCAAVHEYAKEAESPFSMLAGRIHRAQPNTPISPFLCFAGTLSPLASTPHDGAAQPGSAQQSATQSVSGAATGHRKAFTSPMRRALPRMPEIAGDAPNGNREAMGDILEEPPPSLEVSPEPSAAVKVEGGVATPERRRTKQTDDDGLSLADGAVDAFGFERPRRWIGVKVQSSAAAAAAQANAANASNLEFSNSLDDVHYVMTPSPGGLLLSPSLLFSSGAPGKRRALGREALDADDALDAGVDAMLMMGGDLSIIHDSPMLSPLKGLRDAHDAHRTPPGSARLTDRTTPVTAPNMPRLGPARMDVDALGSAARDLFAKQEATVTPPEREQPLMKRGVGKSLNSLTRKTLAHDNQRDSGAEPAKAPPSARAAEPAEDDGAAAAAEAPRRAWAGDDAGDDMETDGSPGQRRGAKPCNCKNSRCLKLYCDCFANSRSCSDCNCTDCHNDEAHEATRAEAIRLTLEKNPKAFRAKIGKQRAHQSGCHCKKSKCLKKYCECFEAGVTCGEKCKCSNCENYGDSAALRARRDALRTARAVAAPSPTVRKTRAATQDAPPTNQLLSLLRSAAATDARDIVSPRTRAAATRLKRARACTAA